MSWSFSPGLVAAFSEATSLDTEPSARSSATPTPDQFYWPDKPMEHSRLSRFGMTSEPLTADRGEALLTWFRAASPAKMSASPAKAMDSMASDPASGARWRGSFAKWDPASCEWKTHQHSLLGGLVEFSETWPRWGSMRNGESSALPTPELRTSENESGSSAIYPTPCTVDGGAFFNRSPSPGAAKRPTLGAMAKHGLWPTPTSGNNHSGGRLDEWGGSRSREAMRALVTPEELTGPLSPTFPEWLMGWPIGWTDLKPLETARFREWLQQHGAS